jgi:hypothetical protein
MTSTSIAANRTRTSLLEPAAVLPAQLIPAFHGDGGLQPERRLMLAVLEDAVLAYQRFSCATTRAGARAFLEAQSWIESDDLIWPVSYRNVCDTLGLDSDALRSGLRAWRARARALPAEERMHLRRPFRRASGTRTRVRGRAHGVRTAGGPAS